MHILSINIANKVMVGGHRPYNLDMALESLDVKVTRIINWRDWGLDRKIVKRLTPTQVNNRMKINKFIDSKDEKRFVLFHGNQNVKLWEIAKKANVPIVLDYRDDPILQSEMNGVQTDIKKANELIEYNLKNADLILFPSMGLMNYHRDFKEKSIVVMNASDPIHFSYIENPLNSKMLYLYPPMPCFFYPEVLDASRLVKSAVPPFGISIIDIPVQYKKEFKNFYNNIRNEYKHKWIKLFKQISYNEINVLIIKYTAGLIAYKKSTYADMATPLKLFDIMACGRPIVSTRCKEIENIIKEANCGLLCDFTKDDLADRMIDLFEKPDLIVKLGQNGRRAIEEKHSWKHRAYDIILALEKI